MRRIAIALAVITGLATSAQAVTIVPQDVPGGPGTWTMLPTGTASDGMPGVFLLNTQTGLLMFCLIARASSGQLTGCGPVPHNPGS